MKITNRLKQTGYGVVVAFAMALPAFADKELSAVPIGKSLTVGSSPMIFSTSYSRAGCSYPIYTLSVVYAQGTNTSVSSATYLVREGKKTIGVIMKETVTDNSKTLEDALNANEFFSEVDASLEAAIKKEQPIKIRVSDDGKRINKLEIYGREFIFKEKIQSEP